MSDYEQIILAERRNPLGRFVVGSKGHLTHGMSASRVWETFRHMRRRCNDPNDEKYPRYGARGITCLWRSFEDFYRDMGAAYEQHVKEFGEKNTQIDRRDNDGPYSKENCRWATTKEQARNKSTNKVLTFNGERKILVEWAEELGIPAHILSTRLRRGWSVEKTLTKQYGRHTNG
jgi:hypothetical protein